MLVCVFMYLVPIARVPTRGVLPPCVVLGIFAGARVCVCTRVRCGICDCACCSAAGVCVAWWSVAEWFSPLCSQMRSDVEAKLGQHFATFEAVACATQIVAGVNYKIKVCERARARARGRAGVA